MTFLVNPYYDVLTPNGFKNFVGVMKSHNEETIVVDGTVCTKDHIFIIDGQEVKASDLPHENNGESFVYDLVEVSGGHTYITDNKVSHNCILIDECLDGETNITVRNKKTGKSNPVKIENLFNALQVNYKKPWRAENSEYEILTKDGWKDFSGINVSDVPLTYKFTFSDYTEIICTPGHQIFDGKKFVDADDICIGDIIDGRRVTSKENISEDSLVYDITDVADGNHFLGNGFTHHNCAFIDNWDQFFTSTFPTITSGKTTQVILVSTPNGLNHFYDMVEGARKGKNDYKLVEVPWWKVPGRDEAWKETVLRGLNNDIERFQQENEIFFMGSSGTLISGWRLKQLITEKSLPIVSKDSIWQYEKPKPDRSYVLVADVSRGKGLDYSAFHVIDVSEMPYKQVLTFRDNLTVPYDYAQIVYQTAKLYNNASVLIETNDIGQQVVDILWNDLEYESVLSTENAGRSGKKISSGFGRSVDMGIRTTKTVKAIGCSILKLLVEQNKLIINDHETINELTTFSKKGTSYEAESGKHDDLVMGLVLFAWLTDQSYFKEVTDINTLYNLREKTDEDIEQSMTPFGFMDDGQGEEADGYSFF